ncbi:uncharacterized protein RAG0_11801 [Rhynchosporium agropyri]|uniref:Uncharacterized protein n=3 Tax=Rhynchosporium TaxID=38037 RepID=A0A1E1MB23_RHYSE|nr:uncharacterized protein RAG0_11801 [Rhynchosporium agropyri]CZT06022.1 uncharacterized protein RCO7_14857 [Rhynchosporium commune]CZT46248.1 uncharacterized protein RSE6_06651 [Rhynchosporium secalis]
MNMAKLLKREEMNVYLHKVHFAIGGNPPSAVPRRELILDED